VPAEHKAAVASDAVHVCTGYRSSDHEHSHGEYRQKQDVASTGSAGIVQGTRSVRVPAGRTLAVKQSTEPQWRETLFMYVRDPDHQTMSIHVEHATKEQEDVNVLLGMADVKDFKSLLNGEIHDLQFDLQG